MDKLTDYIKKHRRALVIILVVVVLFVFFAKSHENYDDNARIFTGRGPEPGPLGLGIYTPNRVVTPWYYGNNLDLRPWTKHQKKEPYVHISRNIDHTTGRGPISGTIDGPDDIGVNTFRKYKENVGYSPFKTLENPTSPIYYTDYSLVDGSTKNVIFDDDLNIEAVQKNRPNPGSCSSMTCPSEVYGNVDCWSCKK